MAAANRFYQTRKEIPGVQLVLRYTEIRATKAVYLQRVPGGWQMRGMCPSCRKGGACYLQDSGAPGYFLQEF